MIGEIVKLLILNDIELVATVIMVKKLYFYEMASYEFAHFGFSFGDQFSEKEPLKKRLCLSVVCHY